MAGFFPRYVFCAERQVVKVFGFAQELPQISQSPSISGKFSLNLELESISIVGISSDKLEISITFFFDLRLDFLIEPSVFLVVVLISGLYVCFNCFLLALFEAANSQVCLLK